MYLTKFKIIIKKKLLADNMVELIKTRLKKSVYNFIPYTLSGWHD